MRTTFAAMLIVAAVSVPRGWAQLAPASTPTRHEIMTRVVDMLRWKAYWESLGSFNDHYTVGKTLVVKIVRSPSAIAVFMPSAGVNLVFRVDDSGHMAGHFASLMVGETNEEAATRYLHNACGRFRRIPNVPQQGTSPNKTVISSYSLSDTVRSSSQVPLVVNSDGRGSTHVCVDQDVKQSRQENFQFELPPLPPPDYVSRRSKPADAMQLQKAVGLAVRQQLAYQSEKCKAAEVTIPYYSRNDPSVFVYVDMGSKCAEFSAIFAFQRHLDGTWEPPDKPWSTRPPNDLSWTTRQIKRTALANYHIP